MAKPTLSKAFAVGLLVTVCTAAFLVAFTFFRKGGYGAKDSYVVHAFFVDATGLTWKSRVQIAGIQVGEVERIVLEGQRARLELRIRNEIDFRGDACLYKRFPSALLPDALLDAVPGTPAAPSLKDLPQAQREVKCVSEGASIAKLMESLGKISADISGLSSELTDAMRGEKGSIQAIIQNLTRTTQNLDRLVAQNVDKLSRILDNAEQVSAVASEVMTADRERYRAIARNVDEAAQKLNRVLGGVEQVLGTQEGGLQDAMTGARSALEKLNKSLDDIQKATTMVAEGKGLAGKLLADERLGERFSATLDGVSSYVDRLVKLQLQVELRSEWLLSQSGAKTYAGLKLLPRPDKYYIFEVVNDPRGASTQSVEVTTTQTAGGAPQTVTTTKQVYDERLRFSLEFAKRYGAVTFRVGVIESSGGFGSDLHLLDDNLQLSMNLYQFSRPQTDWPRGKLFANYRFLRYFYATVGADDIFNTWRSGHYPGGPAFSVGRDVFFGAGVSFTDDDLKTLFLVGGSSIGAATSSGSGVR